MLCSGLQHKPSKNKKKHIFNVPYIIWDVWGKKLWMEGNQSSWYPLNPPFFFNNRPPIVAEDDNSAEVVAIHWIIETKDVAHCKTFPWFPKISFTNDPKVEYGPWNWNSPTISTTIQRYPKNTSLGNLPKGVYNHCCLCSRLWPKRGQSMCDGYVRRYAGVYVW